MKKITERIAFLLFSAMFMLAISSVSTVFAADKTMGITLRIEGIDKNLYYATQEIPYTDSLTIQQALTYIDTKEDSIKLTGVDAAYITEVNGVAAGKFGGWDGWLYEVNGKDIAVGINSYNLSEGDSIVLFYGDPYGVGMQFPVADTSDLKNRVIKFTSSDTTYDANYNPTTKINPIVGATVTWSNGDSTKEYVTDKNGTVKIDAALLTEGSHGIQISKLGDTKIPLVLRFAPDETITVKAADIANLSDTNTDSSDVTVKDTDKSDQKDSEAEITKTDKSNKMDSKATANDTTDSSTKDTDHSAPKTGERGEAVAIYFFLAVATFGGVVFLRRKQYEK